MKTFRTPLIALAAAPALALIAGGPLLAAGDPPLVDSKERPRARPSSQTLPLSKLKLRHDLAAVGLYATFQGDPTQGTAKTILVGTIKNVGVLTYKPGNRKVVIWRKIQNGSMTVASKPVPELKAGKTFVLSYTPPVGDTSTYGVTVSQGDTNPANDVFVPKNEPVEPPR